MKLKYYMRGVGVGILFTMFIFLVIIIPNLQLDRIISNNVTPAADAEGVSGLLGAVEGKNDNNDKIEMSEADPDNSVNTILPKADNAVTENSETAVANDYTDNYENPDSADIVEDAEQADASVTTVETDTTGNAEEDTDAAVSVDENEQIIFSENEPVKEDTDVQQDVSLEQQLTVRISVSGGMTSEGFCKKAEESGLVKSWEELNEYMVSHGYARKLQTDSYTLSSDMSFEEMCKIVTQSR